MADDRLSLPTRRDLVRREVLSGGIAAAAAGAPALLRAGGAFAQSGGDARILESAIRLEQTAVLAYGLAEGSGKLTPRIARELRRIRNQQRDHAKALITALEHLGGVPPAAPTRVGQVRGLAEALAGGQKAILEFAVALEEMAIAFYHGAAQTLADAKLLQLSASIMANEGQHLVLLREALGRYPVPNAFETGEAG
jgi:rubrerythrin